MAQRPSRPPPAARGAGVAPTLPVDEAYESFEMQEAAQEFESFEAGRDPAWPLVSHPGGEATRPASPLARGGTLRAEAEPVASTGLRKGSDR